MVGSVRWPGDRYRTGGVAVLLCVHVAAGCGPDVESAGVVRTDSAGVSIVENLKAAWTAAQAWHIDTDPALDIGGAGIEFERIAGVAFLSDGRLVAGDEGASVLYGFDADGGLLWQTGRQGDGPGEFRLIASLGVLPGDSMWVFDFGSRRFTLLDAGGTVGRTFDLTVAASAPRAVGGLGDGTFIVQEMWGRARDAAATGMRRDPAAVLRVSADGAGADTIVRVPGREVWITVENGRGVMNTPLFSRNSVAVAAGDRIFVGDQARFILNTYDATGAHRLSIRLTGRDQSMDEAVAGRAIERSLETLPEAERPARRRFLESVPLPESRPAFDRIVVAATGEIWVSEPALDPDDAVQWQVIDRTGRWLGAVDLPSAFRLEAVAAGTVAGVWRDALDVQHLRVYRLLRPGDQSAR